MEAQPDFDPSHHSLIPGAQRRARIEVSSPALRTLPSVPEDDHDADRRTSVSPTLARYPNRGAQRRMRTRLSTS
jgi:hypothetical protein